VAARSRKEAGRWETAMRSQSHRHGGGESYSGVIPAKQPNEGRGGPKEVVEGRPLTEENMGQSNSCHSVTRRQTAHCTNPGGRTQSREREPSGLDVCGKQPRGMGSYSSTLCYTT
jgi:hypothetical protein